MSDLSVKMFSVITSFLLLVVYQANGHSYHLGDCPTVEPVPDFDINKFLGVWYVIEKTNTGSSCLLNNFTQNAEHPEKYKIEQISENFLLGLASPDHKYHYTGELTIPNSDSPGAMRVKFPLNVAGGASYTVFATDYDTYAGVFTCQQLSFAHRRSVSILSRTKTLDKAYTEKIRKKLSTYGVDPYNLSVIKQAKCRGSPEDTATTGTVGTVAETSPEHTTHFHIDEDFLTAKSVTNLFRMAGGKIGDGLETVAESAKKVYNKVRGDHDTSNEELNRGNPKDDVEWLP